MTTTRDPSPDRMLIAERGTDWFRALRGLSLASRPFTTVVQAPNDEAFLHDAPWKGEGPDQIVLLCGADLSAATLTSRLALFRHVASSSRRPEVCMVADSERGALATEAFLEVVRSLAPNLAVRTLSLDALGSEQKRWAARAA